jgi:hypothetical protein
MAINLAGVRDGMDVYDSTGDKFATVADVLTLTTYSQKAQSDPYAPGTADANGTTGDGTGATDQNAVLKVKEGGVLGMGAKELYIPVDAVQTVTPGESVTLNCAKSQCETLYADKPSFLDNA